MKRGYLPGALAATALVSLAAGRSASAAGGEVVAIVSKDIAPYKRALSGVVRALPGNPVEILDMDEKDNAAILQRVKLRGPGAIVAIGVKAAKAARTSMPDVPVAYCLVLDPAGNDLLGPRSLGVPFEPSLKDQLETLKKAVPAVTRIGVIINPARPPAGLDQLVASASKAGVTISVEKALDASELHAAATRLVPTVEALAILADPSIVTRDTFKSIADLAIRRKMPVVAATEEFARLGALISLYREYEEAGRDAALVADQLAKGKKTSDVDVPRPDWQIVVNLTTAEAIGVTLSPAVLEAARKVR